MITALAFYSVPKARNGGGYRAAGTTYRAYLDELTETLDLRTGTTGNRPAVRRLIRQWADEWPAAFGYNTWWAYGHSKDAL